MIFFQGDTHSEDNSDKKLYLNNNFYKKLSKISSIEKDVFIAKNKNNFVLGKGKIIFIDKKRQHSIGLYLKQLRRKETGCIIENDKLMQIKLKDEYALKSYNFSLKYT